MPSPSPDLRDIDVPWAPVVTRRPERRGKYALLFLLTFVTTTMVGGCHYASFATDLGATRIAFSTAELYLSGLWYSV